MMLLILPNGREVPVAPPIGCFSELGEVHLLRIQPGDDIFPMALAVLHMR
jgi:hypothetical protein